MNIAHVALGNLTLSRPAIADMMLYCGGDDENEGLLG